MSVMFLESDHLNLILATAGQQDIRINGLSGFPGDQLTTTSKTDLKWLFDLFSQANYNAFLIRYGQKMAGENTHRYNAGKKPVSPEAAIRLLHCLAYQVDSLPGYDNSDICKAIHALSFELSKSVESITAHGWGL